ncbi:hypothetical protein JE952_002542 [Flavobacterium psychrophilum]|nr:hypothetical protein [Flavobacterium psychrophilum]
MKDIFKIMYIIVDKKGNELPYTLSYQKRMCTDAFIKDSNMTWAEIKKHGWKCVKVDVNITPSSKAYSWN